MLSHAHCSLSLSSGGGNNHQSLYSPPRDTLPRFSWTICASWEEILFFLLSVLLLVVNTNGLPLVLLITTLWQLWEELSQVKLQKWGYVGKENFIDLFTFLLVFLLLFLPAIICQGGAANEVLQHVSALLILIGWTR